MLTLLKNKLKNNEYFWKYRHFISKNWYDNYINNTNHPMINIYLNLIKLYNFSVVFEFGCAAGTNLFQIKKNNINLTVLGLDISKVAIKNARENFSNASYKDFIFTTKIRNISKYLNMNKIQFIDFEIIDRTFLYLSDSDLNFHIEFITKNVKYIIINDFFLKEGFVFSNFPKHRDYKQLFINKNFILIENANSLHINLNEKVNPEFILLKNQNIIE